jgi:hypothetical protein
MNRLKKSNLVGNNNPEESRIDRLEKLVENLIGITAKLLQDKTVEYMKQDTKQPEIKSLPSTIKIQPRNTLRQLLTSFAVKTGKEFPETYNGFYNDIYFHLGKNVKLLANRNGIKTIDMIDRIEIDEPGFWNQVIELAKTLYQ